MPGTQMRFLETQHKPSPPCDPSREGLLSTSAKTLPAACLSPRRRTRVGCSIAWIKIFDSVTSGNGTADLFPLLCRWLSLLEAHGLHRCETAADEEIYGGLTRILAAVQAEVSSCKTES
jgi:hypothetical protein